MVNKKYLKTLRNTTIWFLLIGVSWQLVRGGLSIILIQQTEVTEVDTRIITGLLTASSIVYAFSINYLMKKEALKSFSHSVLVLQLIFIGEAGINLYRLGLGLITSFAALHQVALTFIAVFILNFVSLGFYVVDEFEGWWK